MLEKDLSGGSNELITDSPLLSKDMNNAKGGRLHSTIHPERLDPKRFSEMQDDDESPLKIIIYVVLVVVIGVGSAFLVRQLISKDDSTDDDTETQQEETTEETVDALSVNIIAKADSLASPLFSNSDFSDSNLSSVGVANTATSSMSISMLDYQKYTTFGRMVFTIDGLTSGTSFPKTDLSLDSVNNKIDINFNNISTVAADLQSDITVGDGIVTELRYDSVNKKFIVFFDEASVYKVAIQGNTLILDIKTTRQFDIDAAAEENTVVETPEETIEETPVTTPPTGVNLTNDFSQNEQFVTTTATGNTLKHDVFYYEDQGSFFEFSWGDTNVAGEDKAPNASAKLITENNVNYIEVTVQNLQTEAFTVAGISGTSLGEAGFDLSGANFVKIDRTSFSNGTAVYKIQLKNKADYKLLAQPTIDGSTMVLSIQIKD